MSTAKHAAAKLLLCRNQSVGNIGKLEMFGRDVSFPTGIRKMNQSCILNICWTVFRWWIVPLSKTKTSFDQSVWHRDWRHISSPVNTVAPFHLSPPLTETIETTAPECETWTPCRLPFRASLYIKRLFTPPLSWLLNSHTTVGKTCKADVWYVVARQQYKVAAFHSDSIQSVRVGEVCVCLRKLLN